MAIATEERCRISPEPIEAPQPQPERCRDLVFDHAATLGFETMRQAADGPPGLEAFRAGLQIALDYVLVHDRRLR
jgi:hypothetical protein